MDQNQGRSNVIWGILTSLLFMLFSRMIKGFLKTIFKYYLLSTAKLGQGQVGDPNLLVEMDVTMVSQFISILYPCHGTMLNLTACVV